MPYMYVFLFWTYIFAHDNAYKLTEWQDYSYLFNKRRSDFNLDLTSSAILDADGN